VCFLFRLWPLEDTCIFTPAITISCCRENPAYFELVTYTSNPFTSFLSLFLFVLPKVDSDSKVASWQLNKYGFLLRVWVSNIKQTMNTLFFCFFSFPSLLFSFFFQYSVLLSLLFPPIFSILPSRWYEIKKSKKYLARTKKKEIDFPFLSLSFPFFLFCRRKKRGFRVVFLLSLSLSLCVCFAHIHDKREKRGNLRPLRLVTYSLLFTRANKRSYKKWGREGADIGKQPICTPYGISNMD